MASRGTKDPAALPVEPGVEQAEVGTAKDGLHDAVPKLAPIKPEPVERPYAAAVTDEQRAALEAAGIKL